MTAPSAIPNEPYENSRKERKDTKRKDRKDLLMRESLFRLLPFLSANGSYPLSKPIAAIRNYRSDYRTVHCV